jgi:nitrogen regulatory protein P-II 1
LIVKLEVVCADDDLERLIQVIRDESQTRARGDEMIFVSGVSDAMRIRNGGRGQQALQTAGERG